MSAYQRLLTEYARPEDVTRFDKRRRVTRVSPSTKVSLHQSEKRLRWLKDEAYGNSKYKSTEFNVRRSHISNRKLQMTLEKDVLSFAKHHGNSCDVVERKQRQLYEEQLKRSGLCEIHSLSIHYHPLHLNYPQSRASLYYKTKLTVTWTLDFFCQTNFTSL